jgi:gluconate 2-dehydrogenase gamma chain
MSEHDVGRRAFLVGGVVAGLAQPALAKEHHHAKAPAPAAEVPDTNQVVENGDAHGAFFNDEQSATIAAFAERLMPGAPGKPGAREAGVLNYIDLALAGAYADQQDFYRRGLAGLDAYCVKTFKLPFARLGAAQQDEVIGALEAGKASEFSFPTAQAFFNTLRTHTMEGMFADPLYGGNKDFAGWRLVGYPGAQLFYTPADLASKQAFNRAPIAGLQVQAKAASRRV